MWEGRPPRSHAGELSYLFEAGVALIHLEHGVEASRSRRVEFDVLRQVCRPRRVVKGGKLTLAPSTEHGLERIHIARRRACAASWCGSIDGCHCWRWRCLRGGWFRGGCFRGSRRLIFRRFRSATAHLARAGGCLLFTLMAEMLKLAEMCAGKDRFTLLHREAGRPISISSLRFVSPASRGAADRSVSFLQ